MTRESREVVACAELGGRDSVPDLYYSYLLLRGRRRVESGERTECGLVKMAIAARSSYILDLVCMLIHLGTWR